MRWQTPELIDACGPDPAAACRWVHDRTDSVAAAQLVDVLTGAPLRIVLIVILALVGSALIRRSLPRVITRFMQERERLELEVGERFGGPADPATLADRRERNRQRAATLGSVLVSVALAVLWSLTALIVLAEIDVHLGPLLAGAGIAGLAIGFGAQSLVRDLVTGLFILFEDQFGVGDVIDAGVASGVVEQVGFRVTRLRDADGVVWYVPNGEIKRVGNRSQEWSRAVVDVDVAYATDIPTASSILDRTARALWQERGSELAMLDQPQVSGVEHVGGGAFTLRVEGRTAPNRQGLVARALRARIKAALDEAGIEVP